MGRELFCVNIFPFADFDNDDNEFVIFKSKKRPIVSDPVSIRWNVTNSFNLPQIFSGIIYLLKPFDFISYSYRNIPLKLF